jgi:hypothetical protein
MLQFTLQPLDLELQRLQTIRQFLGGQADVPVLPAQRAIGTRELVDAGEQCLLAWNLGPPWRRAGGPDASRLG